MQDRYLVIAIILIIAICCLGGYVAISGFLNNSAPSLSVLTTGIASTPIIVAVSTDTPAPVKTATTAPSGATVAPVPSPLGAFATIAAASSTQLPSTSQPTVSKPTNAPTALPASADQSCSGFAFCPKGGPPDSALGPTRDCPPNYIWGRVTDKNGNGLSNIRIRHKLLSTGDVSDVFTKSPPDPAGAYNIPTGQPGSTWLIWVLDAGNPVSPQKTITTQTYPGTGNCPTRVDFVQQ